jgi:AmiR/NasT family two-component response regulator
VTARALRASARSGALVVAVDPKRCARLVARLGALGQHPVACRASVDDAANCARAQRPRVVVLALDDPDDLAWAVGLLRSDAVTASAWIIDVASAESRQPGVDAYIAAPASATDVDAAVLVGLARRSGRLRPS